MRKCEHTTLEYEQEYARRRWRLKCTECEDCTNWCVTKEQAAAQWKQWQIVEPIDE